jgi:hypothetical protein
MTDGPTLFARYAYPPNALGYCGPDDDGVLLRRGGGVGSGDLEQLARAFDGAWPYLEFIARHTGLDPLDRGVVEAYWLGTDLLDKIDLGEHGDELLDGLRQRAGPVARIPDAVAPDNQCDHNFHCFQIYPWMGLLGAGRGGDHPRRILDRCRIRWGQVKACGEEEVEVRYQPLVWDGTAVALGDARDEVAVRARRGVAFVGDLRPGEWVALHWEWVCDRLDSRRLDDLRRSTIGQLSIVNRQLALTAE